MALIANTAAGSTNTTDVTTAAINTTGAALIVVAVSDQNGTAAVTDNKGNSWTPLTAQVTATVNGAVRLHYVINPAVWSGHTFTATGAYPAAAVMAHSYGRYGAETGALGPSPITTPALTPARGGALFVSGYTNQGSLLKGFVAGYPPFVDVDQVQFVNAKNYTVSSAYYEQGAASSQAVTWAVTGAFFPNSAAVLAVFEVAPPVSGGYPTFQISNAVGGAI